MNTNKTASYLLLLFGESSDEYKRAAFEKYGLTIWDISNVLYYIKDNVQCLNELTELMYFPISDIEPRLPFGWKPDAEFIIKPAPFPLDASDDLMERLKQCPVGKLHAQTYEIICGEIIQHLFGSHFSAVSNQHKTRDEIFRMDLICSLKGSGEFWKILERYYHSRFIVFEFKNYAKTLPQNMIFITEKYLFRVALRTVAFIVSRKGFAANAASAAVGCLKESGKLMLDITDEDLLEMLRRKKDGLEPADFLMEKLEQLLMSISK